MPASAWIRATARAGVIFLSASVTVLADQNDNQTAVTGTEAADVIAVDSPQDADADVSTSTGDTLNATATGIDALAGNDTISNTAGLTTSAGASASLTSQPAQTRANATSTGITAAGGDDEVTSSSAFNTTANALGVYAGSLQYTQPETSPPKDVDVSISSTSKATGVSTGDGDDTVTSDALFTVTALATSGGTADQLNSTVRESVNLKSGSSAGASAKGVEAGEGDDRVTNNGAVLNTATATSGALAIALVAPQGTPTPDPDDPTAPPKPKKTQIKSDSSATASADAVGIDADEDETEDSSEDSSPFGLDGLRVTYQKTVTATGGNDTIENTALLTNLATATSGAGSAAVSNEVDGTVDSTATSEATAKSTGIAAGTGRDTVTNSGELLSAATATAGALSVSLVAGAPSAPGSPAPEPGQPPKPPAPSTDKENKASSKTNVTATARAIGIDVAGGGQVETTTGSAEITDGALVIDYRKTTTSSEDDDTVTNQGFLQALGNATAASENASVVISSGGSTSVESKSTATSYGAAITTGGGNDTVTNSGALTTVATSNASALTLGLSVGKAQETAPPPTTPPPGGGTTTPAAAPSKLATSAQTEVSAEAESIGIDAEDKSDDTTVTRRLSIGTSGLTLSETKSQTASAGNDTIVNDGIVTSTATADADSTDASIEMEAAGSVSSQAASTAKAASTGIYTGAGNDSITNNALLSVGANAAADSLSVGLVVSKPPEQAPTDGGTTPPAPDPTAKKDKSNIKVNAGATAQANATGIDAEGAEHDKSYTQTLAIGGNALELSFSASDAATAGADTVINRGVLDVDATASSGAIAAAVAIQGAASVDADAESKAQATSGAILTGGGADTVENAFLITSDANATATSLAVSVSVTQPTDSTGSKPPTLEAMKDTYSAARSNANATAESNATGIDAEGGAHLKEESRSVRLGFDGLLVSGRDQVSSLAGNDEVINSGAMLVNAVSTVGAGAIDVKVESEGTAGAQAKAAAQADSAGILTGGGSDIITNSGELLSTATSIAGVLGTSVSIGATPGSAQTPPAEAGKPPKPKAPTDNKENKASSNTSVTSTARAMGIDAEGTGQAKSSDLTLEIGFTGVNLRMIENEEVTSASGNDTVTNEGAIQAIGSALAASRNATVAVSSSGSLSAESKATATSAAGSIATGAGDDSIANSGALTTVSTANASAITLGLAIGKAQETTPPAGGGSTSPTTPTPSKLTTSTETTVQADATAFGIDAEGKATGTTSNRELVIDSEGLRIVRQSTETSSAGDDTVLNDGTVTSIANATADSTDAAIELEAVGSVSSESHATAVAASAGIHSGGGNDEITNNGLLTAGANATADSLSLGLTVSKPPEQSEGGGGSTPAPDPAAKKDKSNVKVEAGATAQASAAGIDAEGSRHDKSRGASLIIGGNTLELSLQRGHVSQSGTDVVINRGIVDVDADATSGAVSAGIAINAAGSIDADARSKASATTGGILTGGGADVVDNTALITSDADATATALAVAVSVSQPTDSTGARPGTLDKLKDVFATAHGAASAEAESRSTGIDTEGAAHDKQETITIGNGGDGRIASAVSETTSLAGDDRVTNSGAVFVTAGALAGAGAAEVKVETEGTASAESKADAKATTGAVLTGGGNDVVTNTGGLTSTATATAGALAVSFTQSGGLGAKAKSDADATSNARAQGIVADADEVSRRTELGLTLSSDGVGVSLTDTIRAASGTDAIVNQGLVSSTAVATTGSAGAAIAIDGSASSDVNSLAKSQADAIDGGGGADAIENDGLLTSIALSTSNALSVAFGQKGDEETQSKVKAEASSTAEATAAGILGDSGQDIDREATLEISSDGVTLDLLADTRAASGDDVITNRGAIASLATATSGAEAASIAIDGVAKADVAATAKSRATAIDSGGGNDEVLSVGVLSATAVSTATTLTAGVGQKTGSDSSARTKVTANTTAEAAAAGITTDGSSRNETLEAGLTIDDSGLNIDFSSISAAVSGDDVLENLAGVTSTATATTQTLTTAVSIKGAANAAANSTASADSLALDTGGGADEVINRGDLAASARSAAATQNIAISTEGRAISNSGFMGAGTTAKSRAVGISTAGLEQTLTTELEESIDFNSIDASLRIEATADGLSADGNDDVFNTGTISAVGDAQAPRLNAGITGSGVAVSMGRATSEAYAGGIDTGNLDDTIDNRGSLDARATSMAALANVAATGKGLAVAANAVWDGGTEAQAEAAGINADSGSRTTTTITADATADLARVRYNQDVQYAAGDDQIVNSGEITSFARAEAPNLNVGLVTGRGLAASVSTATATAESTAIRAGDGDDDVDNSGELSSRAEAIAAAANAAVTNEGVAIAADAVWDGGTKANATAIGIAGDGGDRSRSTFVAVGTDLTTRESTTVLADGIDTIENSGDITASSLSQALSASAAVTVRGVGVATSTATSTSRATAIDAGAGTSVDGVTNTGDLTATANAEAAAASISVTNQGVAISADSVWDGGTKASAHARGIDVGAGAETVVNSGGIAATADADTFSFAGAVAISGVAGATATSTGKADATAIDASAGDDADTIINSGDLTVLSDSTARSAAVSFTNSGLSIAAGAVWDGGTTATARARGIDVGESGDEIVNSGDISATGDATAAALAAALTVSGVAGATTTSTTDSSVIAIDAGDDAAADTVVNSGDLIANSIATSNTAAISLAMSGVAVSADAPWDGGTGANAVARGINVGLGADRIDNAGDVIADAQASTRSATISITPSGVAGAITTSTSTSDAAALDTGAGVDDDVVTNSGALTARSEATAASAALSFTMAGVAVSGGSFWDGGTRADSDARTIALGAGVDRVDNDGDLIADASATATSVSASVAVEGVAGAITASTAEADAIAIDAAAGDDVIFNSAFIDADSFSDANTISVAGTKFGVSVAGNNAWTGGATSTARTTGISGGTGLDTLVNSGDIDSTADAVSPSVAVAFTVGGVSAAVSTATSKAEARAIDGGDDADRIDNTGALTVLADSDAVAVNASIAGVGGALAADSVWDGGTTARAEATGIHGGAGDDEINNTTEDGSIAATANATASSIAVAVTGGGFAGSISTSTATGETAAIDGGDGADDIFNDSNVLGRADARATSVSASIAGSGVALAADAFWSGGTQANATAAGIAGGADADDIVNAGEVVAEGESHTFSASVAASLSPSFGLAGAVAASTSTARATALDGGAGDDFVANAGTARADSDAFADGVSFSFTPFGGAVSGGFDATTRADAGATAMAGAGGADELLNTEQASLEFDSSARTRNVSVALTAAGVSFADANSAAVAAGVGIDGGAGADTLRNEGLVTGTVGSTASSLGLSFAGLGLASASAGSTGHASGAGLAGGDDDDRLENLGEVDLQLTATATGNSIGAAQAGLALSSASADAIAGGVGQRGDDGEDVLINEGSIAIDASATTTVRSISAAQLGVSIAAANSTATAAGTGLSGGEANDVLANNLTGVVDVLARANVNSGSASIAIAGATNAEARSVTAVSATGLAGDAGDDAIGNAGLVTVRGRSESSSVGGSMSVAGAASARAGTEVETVATGLSGGSGADEIVNTGTVVVGPEGDQWMSRLATGALSIGFAGDMEAQSAAYARTSSTGIDGGSEDDEISNTGEVSVVANALSQAGSGALSIFGSAEGGGESGAFTRATGIDGAAGNDLMESLETLSVTARSRLEQGSASFTFGGSGETGAKLEAGTEASGMSGGEGNDQIWTAGTITVDAGSVLSSTGGGSTVFGTAAVAGASGATTRAVGVDGGAGEDRIDSAADLTLSATSQLSMNNASYTFGGTGETGAELAATTSVDGILGGDGRDVIGNSGAIDIDALSTMSSSGGSDTTFGGATSSVTSGGRTTARGLAGGEADDVIENRADGSINLNARTSVTANAVAYTFAGGGSQNDAVLTGEANAAGIAGDAGADVLVNRGDVMVRAEAELVARGGAKTSVTGLSNPVATGVAEVAAKAQGMAGGEGDDTIVSSGTLQVSAFGAAEARNEASTNGFSIVNGNVAGAVTRSDVEATGIEAGSGTNVVDLSGMNSVQATSTSYALALSSGATVSLGSNGESRARSSAAARATGVAAQDGDDEVTLDDRLSVNANATTARLLLVDITVYRDVRAENEDDELEPPETIDADALPVLTNDDGTPNDENRELYPQNAVVFWTQSPPDEQEPNNSQEVDGGHYIVRIEMVDPDGPEGPEPAVEEWRWEFLAGGLIQPVVIQEVVNAFPTYAAANGSGLSGTGRASASGTGEAVAKGVSLGEGDNVVDNAGELIVRADAEAVINVSSDGDGFGDAFGTSLATASASAIGIELGSGNDEVANSGEISVTAVPVAQALANVTGGDICIWFFGWWCGGGGDGDGTARATFNANATGISAGGGTNLIVNDGDITVLSAPEVRDDERTGEFAADVRQENLPQEIEVRSTSRAVGIETGDGDDEIVNSGSLSVEARDLLSSCLPPCRPTPSASQVLQDTVSAAGILTGAGNDIVRNTGSLSVLIVDNGVASETIGIDTGAGNDQLFLGDGSTITGTVALGDGDDTLTLSGTPSIADVSGALIDVDAGAGTDTLALDGAGIYTGTPLSIERAIKLGAGTYTLSSLVSMQSITIDQGTLRIESDYQFDADGSFATMFSVDGSSGLLDVDGDTNLAGSIDVEKRGSAYVTDGARYTVVQATDGIDGGFATVSLPQPSALLSFELEQSAATLDVVANAASFTTVTGNPHYRVIATQLDGLGPSSTSDFAEVLGTLQAMNGEDDFDRAFASFSPEAHLATSSDTLVTARQMTRVLQAHLGDTRTQYRHAPQSSTLTAGLTFSGDGGGLGSMHFGSMMLAPAPPMAQTPPLAGSATGAGAQARHGNPIKTQLWALGIDAASESESVGGYSAFDADTTGYLLGYDMHVGEQWIVGVNYGRASTDVSVQAVASRGEIDAWLASAFATWFNERAYVEVGASYGEQEFDNLRSLIVGPTERFAASVHDGDAWTAFAGAGYAIGSGSFWSVEPYASLQYFSSQEESFEETGADSMNQIVAARGTETLYGEAGINLSLVHDMESSFIDWHASLGTGYDFGIDDANIEYAYAADPQSLFVIGARESARRSTVFGAGVSWIGNRSTVSLDYGAQHSGDREEEHLSARMTVKF